MFTKRNPTPGYAPTKPLEVPPRYLKVPPDPGGSAATPCDMQAPHNKCDGNVAQQQHDTGHCNHCSTRCATPCSAIARTEGTMPLFMLRNASCGPPTQHDTSESVRPPTTAVVHHHGTRPPTTTNGKAHSTPHNHCYWGRDPNVEQPCSTSSQHKHRRDDAPTRPRHIHSPTKPVPIEPERHHALWSIDSRYLWGQNSLNNKLRRVESKQRRRPHRHAHSDATRRGIEPGGCQTTGSIDIRYVRGPQPHNPDVRCDHHTMTPAPIEPARHHAIRTPHTPSHPASMPPMPHTRVPHRKVDSPMAPRQNPQNDMMPPWHHDRMPLRRVGGPAMPPKPSPAMAEARHCAEAPGRRTCATNRTGTQAATRGHAQMRSALPPCHTTPPPWCVNTTAHSGHRGPCAVQSVHAQHIKPVAVPAQHANPGVVPAQHTNPAAVPAQHANPGVVQAKHIKPVAVPAQHANPGVVQAKHIKPVAVPAQHANPGVVQAKHIKPMAVPAQHANPGVVPAQHSKPRVVQAKHSKPMAVPAQHANPGVVPAQHSKPRVVQAKHRKPTAVPAQHAKPGVVPAQHSKPGVVQAKHSKPVAVPAQHDNPGVVHAQHIKPAVYSLSDVYALYALPNVGEQDSCHHFILQM